MRELDRDLLRFGDLEKKKKDTATHDLFTMIEHPAAYRHVTKETTNYSVETETQFDTKNPISDANLEPECDLRPCLPSLIDERSISIDKS